MINQYIEHRLDKIHEQVKANPIIIEDKRKLERLVKEFDCALAHLESADFNKSKKGN